MTSFHLKLIAITTMLIDHIGAVLFPEIIVFRIIGRLAFPLFAFLLTEGYRHTSNLKSYLIRLGIFALISQYPFWEAFGYDAGLNIFFTLTIGLFAIYLFEKHQTILPILIFGLLADLTNMDYGMFGIILIFLFYYYRFEFSKLILYLFGLYSLFFIPGGLQAGKDAVHYYMQFFALFSLIFIKLYNGREGIKLKYFFYLFYPGHILILSLM